jgi:hypothetical protein
VTVPIAESMSSLQDRLRRVGWADSSTLARLAATRRHGLGAELRFALTQDPSVRMLNGVPDRIVPVVAASLWDLRSQCESQVRSLTDAQRQLDIVRDGRDGELVEAVAQLKRDLDLVARANAEIRTAVREALEQADRLASLYRVDHGKE